MIIKHDENVNPYKVNYHRDDCPEDIWRSESDLISTEELRSLKCEACDHDHQLWFAILKATEDKETGKQDPIFGDLAFRGFDILKKVTDYHFPAMNLDPFDYDLMEAVSQAQAERRGFHEYELNKKVENNNG